jgi:hypothetical protein
MGSPERSGDVQVQAGGAFAFTGGFAQKERI